MGTKVLNIASLSVYLLPHAEPVGEKTLNILHSISFLDRATQFIDKNAQTDEDVCVCVNILLRGRWGV